MWIAASEATPLYVSTNRGATWSEAEGGPPVGEWAVRILRDRSQARTVYALTSAGLMYKLYRSDDGGTTFTVVSSGQNAGSLPDLWIDRVRGGPLYLVLGFDQLVSGDYGSLTSSDGTHNRLYASYPGFILIQMREGENVFEAIDFPAPLDERAQFWIAPLVADPEDPDVVFYGDWRIWRVERQESGAYPAEALPHDFSEEQGGYVTSFAISPADRNRWYAATSAGRLWSSTDGGTTWALGGDFNFFIPTDVLPSPTDPEVCYVSGSGYGDGISVYRTTDGGATWHPHAEGLPQTVVRALAFDDPVRQTLYAATQAGPFRYDEASASWVNLLGTQAPLTRYTDVEGVPAEGVVRFATYGRGIWDFSPP